MIQLEKIINKFNNHCADKLINVMIIIMFVCQTNHFS